QMERQAFAEAPTRTIRMASAQISVRAVPVSDHIYKLYYNDFSNNVLWFLHHYLYSSEIDPSFGENEYLAWAEGYVAVNRLVADTLIQEMSRLSRLERQRAIVLLQDYHLYLVSGYLREAFPSLAMTHFIHIPWPDLRYWQHLPHQIGKEILTG